ncbi:HTH-type transcriptional regulator GltC [Pigmentiphaga humi]|uniref:HTH-type transcriptional regulator GltC n=1 Tax=Pigmentiphaga humi TaxID=2478468 RepID=A0A3P4B3D5_9BURK|nr:LysR family transcriptional regulator [Pigmentiphaga humi]VCU70803.1 HTH-type transcriptional regulator GltC [Pigmentiphaga humi]
MTQQTVPLRILRVVASVAETGGITKSAKALHQSASSITRAVQSAESALGIPLFDRGARGMAPTAAGAMLTLRIGRAMHVLRDAADGLQLRGAPASVATLPRLVNDSLLAALSARAAHATESAAADALGLSQPALHQALRRLEHLAKVQLFERTRVGTRLNESGRWLLLHAQQALDEIRIGHEELARWRGLGGRNVAIGSLPMTGDVLVPRTVALTLESQPDICLTIKGGTYESLIAMLRSAEIDFLVGPLRGAALAGDLVEEELFVDRFVAVVRSGHPLMRGRQQPSLVRMAGYPWIGPLPGTPAQQAFDQLFAQAGLAAPWVSMQVNSTAVLRSLLLAGNHIALVSPLQVHADVAAGLLAHASEPLPGTERSIGITQRRGALASSACEQVLAALRQAVQETAAPASL